jgi:hypothetical protein
MIRTRTALESSSALPNLDQGLRRRRNDDFFLFKSKIQNQQSRIINHSLSSLLMPLLSPSAISRRARHSRIPLLFSPLTPCGDKSARPAVAPYRFPRLTLFSSTAH